MKYIKFALALLLSVPCINAQDTGVSTAVTNVENVVQSIVAKVEQTTSTVAAELKPVVNGVANAAAVVAPKVDATTTAPVGKLQSLFNSLVGNKYSQAAYSKTSTLLTGAKNALWTNRSTASKVAIVAAAAYLANKAYEYKRTKKVTFQLGYACCSLTREYTLVDHSAKPLLTHTTH